MQCIDKEIAHYQLPFRFKSNNTTQFCELQKISRKPSRFLRFWKDWKACRDNWWGGGTKSPLQLDIHQTDASPFWQPTTLITHLFLGVILAYVRAFSNSQQLYSHTFFSHMSEFRAFILVTQCRFWTWCQDFVFKYLYCICNVYLFLRLNMRNKSVENRAMTWRIYLVARVKLRVIVEYWEGDSTYEGRALRVPGMQPWCGQKILKKRES